MAEEKMKTTDEMFDELMVCWEEFKTNHYDRNKKIAAQRARKALVELKKLIADYKKASLTEVKNMPKRAAKK